MMDRRAEGRSLPGWWRRSRFELSLKCRCVVSWNVKGSESSCREVEAEWRACVMCHGCSEAMFEW
ncbi:hypothetical protein E2C01_095247 [Portunus trituberculatus]|uniref:Uncharacterized protein n=1 Tax=Portunus trituberculatus TaxID=210409 RepID=A0A5B7K378_PORTR|nr:hypothetical protein [Portunus trituberculatus]